MGSRAIVARDSFFSGLPEIVFFLVFRSVGALLSLTLLERESRKQICLASSFLPLPFLLSIFLIRLFVSMARLDASKVEAKTFVAKLLRGFGMNTLLLRNCHIGM